MIKVYVANLEAFNDGKLIGEWIDLPCDNLEERVNKILSSEGYDSEEYEVQDYETELHIKIGQYENVYKINDLAERIEALDKYDLEKLEAILEYEYANTDNLGNFIDSMDNYNLYGDIHNEYDLGYYYIRESGCYDLSELGTLVNYFDYESFGRDLKIESNGTFTKHGWLEYNG